MAAIDRYRGGEIHIKAKPSYDPLQELINASAPERGQFVTFTGDEETFFRNQSLNATRVFERNRNRVRDSLRILVAYLWERYNLPKENIVEYGAGATGYFDGILEPGDIPHWRQFDINPRAVAENKRRNPQAMVEEGSYKRIEKRDLSMIAGLSAWDTTSDLPQAIQQVADALKDDGYSLHIQDVRPGVGCVMSYLEKVVGFKPTQGWTVPVEGRDVNTDLLGLMVDGKRRTMPDIFKNAIEHGINSEPRLDLVVNNYFTLREVMQDLSPLLIEDLREIYFLNFYGAVLSQPKKLPMGLKERDTTVLVTLAKRKTRRFEK